MLYCDKCNISIRTQHEYCPLCHGGLRGELKASDLVYPNVNPKRARTSFLSIVTFICVSIIVIVYILNKIFTPQSYWGNYVIGATICLWGTTAIGIYKKRNILKNAMWQILLLSLGMIIWDIKTGWNKWSLNIAIPILVVVTLLFCIIIILIKKLPYSEYMIYLFINIFLGLIPFVLLKIKFVTLVAPSIICSGISIIVLAALIIFKGKVFIQELQKSFNM